MIHEILRKRRTFFSQKKNTIICSYIHIHVDGLVQDTRARALTNKYSNFELAARSTVNMLYELIHNYSRWPRHWMNTYKSTLYVLLDLIWFDFASSCDAKTQTTLAIYVYMCIRLRFFLLCFLSLTRFLVLILSLCLNAPLEVIGSLIVCSPFRTILKLLGS